MLSGLYEATALLAYRRQTASEQLTTEFVSVGVGQDDTELSLLHLSLLQCLELPAVALLGLENIISSSRSLSCDSSRTNTHVRCMTKSLQVLIEDQSEPFQT